MDKVTFYRKVIQDELQRFIDMGKDTRPSHNVEDQAIFDEKRDRYLVMVIGWSNRKRTYFPVFQIDIINSKIWVQQNMSDYDIVGKLELKGIPRADIVLAFHAPSVRKFTEYAEA